MPDDRMKYPGKELSLFQHAHNWKGYFAARINPFIGANVLEVGAGIGANTSLLNIDPAKQWSLLEPDQEMAEILREKLRNNTLPSNCKLIGNTTSELLQQEEFDTIIYIDVLEHIQNDEAEIRTAASLLKPGGNLIVLSPAFPKLYSPFDKAIGHYRRYTKKQIDTILPASFRKLSLQYLDSLGFFASLSNRFILKQEYPSQKQVDFWDSYIVPVSRILDKIIIYSFGKAILGIWKKN